MKIIRQNETTEVTTIVGFGKSTTKKRLRGMTIKTDAGIQIELDGGECGDLFLAICNACGVSPTMTIDGSGAPKGSRQ